jgi:hypothetical protein
MALITCRHAVTNQWLQTQEHVRTAEGIVLGLGLLSMLQQISSSGLLS